MSAPLSAETRHRCRSSPSTPFDPRDPIVHPGELPSGPASSHATWSAANSLIDQNAALWASLRPPARPSWPVLVRQRVSELSLVAVREHLHVGVPRWFGTRPAAQRWLLSATMGIVLGLVLGVAARFSESPPRCRRTRQSRSSRSLHPRSRPRESVPACPRKASPMKTRWRRQPPSSRPPSSPTPRGSPIPLHPNARRPRRRRRSSRRARNVAPRRPPPSANASPPSASFFPPGITHRRSHDGSCATCAARWAGAGRSAPLDSSRGYGRRNRCR